jgi:hypothetical protein
MKLGAQWRWTPLILVWPQLAGAVSPPRRNAAIADANKGWID